MVMQFIRVFRFVFVNYNIISHTFRVTIKSWFIIMIKWLLSDFKSLININDNQNLLKIWKYQHFMFNLHDCSDCRINIWSNSFRLLFAFGHCVFHQWQSMEYNYDLDLNWMFYVNMRPKICHLVDRRYNLLGCPNWSLTSKHTIKLA